MVRWCTLFVLGILSVALGCVGQWPPEIVKPIVADLANSRWIYIALVAAGGMLCLGLMAAKSWPGRLIACTSILSICLLGMGGSTVVLLCFFLPSWVPNEFLSYSKLIPNIEQPTPSTIATVIAFAVIAVASYLGFFITGLLALCGKARSVVGVSYHFHLPPSGPEIVEGKVVDGEAAESETLEGQLVDPNHGVVYGADQPYSHHKGGKRKARPCLSCGVFLFVAVLVCSIGVGIYYQDRLWNWVVAENDEGFALDKVQRIDEEDLAGVHSMNNAIDNYENETATPQIEKEQLLGRWTGQLTEMTDLSDDSFSVTIEEASSFEFTLDPLERGIAFISTDKQVDLLESGSQWGASDESLVLAPVGSGKISGTLVRGSWRVQFIATKNE